MMHVSSKQALLLRTVSVLTCRQQPNRREQASPSFYTAWWQGGSQIVGTAPCSSALQARAAKVGRPILTPITKSTQSGAVGGQIWSFGGETRVHAAANEARAPQAKLPEDAKVEDYQLGRTCAGSIPKTEKLRHQLTPSGKILWKPEQRCSTRRSLPHLQLLPHGLGHTKVNVAPPTPGHLQKACNSDKPVVRPHAETQDCVPVSGRERAYMFWHKQVNSG
eukprot:1124338-Pelagomonas_calceolata.AAC.13